MKASHLYSLFCLLFLATTVATAQTYFTNVIEETGMNFDHLLDGVCPNPPVGSGSAWADYDNDGDIDFFITNHGGPNPLFQNQGDTNGDDIPDFIDVAPALGIDDATRVSHGAVFIDYDNDGDQDLYVTHWGGNNLYQNQLTESGTAEFIDVTTFAGVGNADRALTAAWADYDQDGYLDLYLAKHFDCMPNIRESRDALYKNNGDGTFTNVSQYLCSDGSVTCDALNLSHAFSAGWFDFDNDSDLDLYIASDVVAAGYPNVFWRNDGPDGLGGWLFTDISVESGTDYSVNAMGLGIGDYDNDGWYDLAFSHTEGGFLLRNNANGVDFTDVSVPSGTRATTTVNGHVAVTWGTVFFDYDNDQWADLFFVRGKVGTDPTPQPDALFHNNQDGTFTDAAIEAGVDDNRRGRSASICDFDQDGMVDLFIGNYGWPTCLFRNDLRDFGNTNHWLTITAQGTDSNRDAIGTRFYLTTADGIRQMRDITSGPTHGGGDYKAAYFGLGQHMSGELEIHWPNGLIETFTVNADQKLHYIEPMETSVDGDEPIASEYRLSQNYPNPFNPTTVIKYSVPTGSDVSLKVYDELGREVATLVDGFVSAGSHQVSLDASTLASGMYVYRLTSGTFSESRKLVVLK